MSKHLRGVASRCAAAFLLALVSTPGQAQERVSIGYASITLNFSPLWGAMRT